MMLPFAVDTIRRQALLCDCWQYVPFYRKHWARAGLNLDALRQADAFKRLPITRKADLLACDPADRIDERYRACLSDRTSGSAGQPVEIQVDARTLRRRRWRFLHALRESGYRIGDRLMLITTPPYPRGARLLNWHYADLQSGEEGVLAAWRAVAPHVLYGPLSSLMMLARRISSDKSMLPLRRIVSTAEQLRSADREFLEHVFGVPVIDFYGMTETGLLAYSAGARQGIYRLASADLKLEYERGHNDQERLVVTDLAGGMMPLIRYDTGDLVRRARYLPGAPIVQFTGRAVDCLLLPNGRMISPFEISQALERIDGVAQYHLEQFADYSVHLRIMPRARSDTALREQAESALLGICGSELPVSVELATIEPPTCGDKPRYVRSHITAATTHG